MTTQHHAEAESHHRSSRDVETSETIVWPLLECLVGGAGAGIVFVLSLPILADILSPLGVLSPTGLTFVLLFAWLFLWLLSSVSRERVIG